jgi:glutathione peroxidase
MIGTKIAGLLVLMSVVGLTYQNRDIFAVKLFGKEEQLDPVDKTFFQLESTDVDGNAYKFSQLSNYKAVLIFNSASLWGLTHVSYTQLTEIYNKYHSQGLEIIDVPSNDFLQEPKSDATIKKWVHDTFGSTFPILTKQHVNGSGSTVPELYRYLRLNSNCFDKATGKAKQIDWNYAKFLVSKEGVTYYTPTTTPNSLIGEIERLLAA